MKVTEGKTKKIGHAIGVFLKITGAGLVWMALTWGKTPIAALVQYSFCIAAIYLLTDHNNKNAKKHLDKAVSGE